MSADGATAEAAVILHFCNVIFASYRLGCTIPPASDEDEARGLPMAPCSRDEMRAKKSSRLSRKYNKFEQRDNTILLLTSLIHDAVHHPLTIILLAVARQPPH